MTPIPAQETHSVYQIAAFVALFIAFVSLVLLTQVPPIDDQSAMAVTTWGQSVSVTAASDGCDPGCGGSRTPMQAGR